MANNFPLELDTLGPANPAISLNSNAQYSTTQLVTATLTTGSADTTTMKIWGDLDLAQAKTDGLVGGAATGTAESDALWITFTGSKQLTLSAANGTKTVYVKFKDDVGNVSGQASDTITLDTSKPTVTISGPDRSKISEQSGFNESNFTFTVDQDIKSYKVMYVASTGAAHTAGTQIPTAGGSTGVSGTGSWTAGTVISVKVTGTDWKAAKGGTDGVGTVKVFVEDPAGNWSV